MQGKLEKNVYKIDLDFFSSTCRCRKYEYDNIKSHFKQHFWSFQICKRKKGMIRIQRTFYKIDLEIFSSTCRCFFLTAKRCNFQIIFQMAQNLLCTIKYLDSNLSKFHAGTHYLPFKLQLLYVVYYLSQGRRKVQKIGGDNGGVQLVNIDYQQAYNSHNCYI